MLEIVRLSRESQAEGFLELAHQVYEGSPWPWVPPLRVQLRAAMGALQGPTRGHFLALRDGRPVARLGATVHRYPGYEALHFGFYECLAGEAAATARLLEAARALAPGLPMRGPYQYRQEDFYTGLLTEGFDDAPSYGTAFNPPYYQALLTGAGLRSVMRLVTYAATEADHRPELLRTRAQRALAGGVSVRSLNPWRRLRDVRAAVGVMNDTLRDNWGFEPIGWGQTLELYLLSLLFLDPQWLKLAEWQGKTVGTLILLPDCNPWLRESRGRLTPRLLWRLWRRSPGLDRLRAWALGIRPEARAVDVTAALLDSIPAAALAAGFRRVELSWILEDNHAMHSLVRALGLRRTRTHEILEC